MEHGQKLWVVSTAETVSPFWVTFLRKEDNGRVTVRGQNGLVLTYKSVYVFEDRTNAFNFQINRLSAVVNDMKAKI